MLKKYLSICISVLMIIMLTASLSSVSSFANKIEPTEIIELRTEFGKHFDNGNGIRKAYISTIPLHFMQDNNWVDIDNTLVLDEDGKYKNANNSFGVTIPSDFSDTLNRDNGIELSYEGYDISVVLDNISYTNSKGETSNVDKQTSTNDYLFAKVTQLQNMTDCNKMPESFLASYNKEFSNIVYESVYNDVDLSIDIRPKSVIESIEFNNVTDVSSSLTYFIKTDDLILEKEADNHLIFKSKNDKIVFEVPRISIKDSSDYAKEFQMDCDIEETYNGYLLTLSPSSYITDFTNLSYPIIMSMEYTVQPSVQTFYNSESNPNSIFYNDYIRIGNYTNDGCQTYVSLFDSFAGYTGNVTITDATFYFYILSYYNTYKTIDIYSLQTQPINCTWNNSSTLNTYNTKITSFNVSYDDCYTWKEIDIKSLVQSWVNYGRTSYIVGIPAYGFKMVAEGAPYTTVSAYSERASYNQPYCEIEYTVSSDYILEEAPYKYNDITTNSLGNIYNFQHRMNCYAYALQMYCRDSSSTDFYPGEIGLSQTDPSYVFTDITTFGNLEYAYEHWASYSALHNNASYMNFLTEQMYKDAQAMGYNISMLTPYNKTTLLSYINNDYNPNNGRLIALASTVSYDQINFHYYVRNGNGSCHNANHGTNCSVWTDKDGQKIVEGGTNEYCDQKICTQIISYNNANCTPVFYLISKDTNVYNAWYYYNHNSNSTGTQFVYT